MVVYIFPIFPPTNIWDVPSFSLKNQWVPSPAVNHPQMAGWICLNKPKRGQDLLSQLANAHFLPPAQTAGLGTHWFKGKWWKIGRKPTCWFREILDNYRKPWATTVSYKPSLSHGFWQTLFRKIAENGTCPRQSPHKPHLSTSKIG
jgi:hypothetical protein